ncbi:MAG: DNA ligase, partial [Planctomycetaceae bacterium]
PVLHSGALKQSELEALIGRAKFVRSAFVEKVKRSTHWQ